MILNRFAFALMLGLSAFTLQTPAMAETAIPSAEAQARIAALSQSLKIGAVMEVMRAEGLEYGKTLETELFPGAGGSSWAATVEQIYDPAAMAADFEAAMTEELSADPEILTQIEAFFATPETQALLQLEIEARRALLNSDVEDLAKTTEARLRADKDPLIDLIDRFAVVGDLIEMNVAGALNANLAFYRGMALEGAFGEDMTEDQMLTEVWSQEPDVRAETEKWLFPYLAMAYSPAPKADLEAYIAFSDTPAGHRLNAALFKAFDRIFGRISYSLGQAAGRKLAGDDI